MDEPCISLSYWKSSINFIVIVMILLKKITALWLAESKAIKFYC